jgi:hypothetical protein
MGKEKAGWFGVVWVDFWFGFEVEHICGNLVIRTEVVLMKLREETFKAVREELHFGCVDDYWE